MTDRDTFHLATMPGMCKDMVSLYPDITEKIQSLAVEISSRQDFEKSAVDIGTSNLSNLREITIVVGPEVSPKEAKWFKGWLEMMKGFKGCIVRVKLIV